MKKSDNTASLFATLTRSFLAFTLTLLVMAAALYALWARRADTWFGLGDVEGMLASRAFCAGEYERVDTVRYLGNGGGFAVFDADGKACGGAPVNMPRDFTPEELACIPEYDENTYVSLIELEEADGQTAYLVLETALDGAGQSICRVQLDENYRVLRGGLGDGRTSYTQREFQLMTQTYSTDYELYRVACSGADGAAYTVLVRLPLFTQQHYDRAVSRANRIWALLIPLYLVTTVGFILDLRRRIGRPLARLDEAIVRFGHGEPADLPDSRGPAEIVRLTENFSAMAERLARSERERDALDAQRKKLIADISHDLKTPITVIAGYTRAIRDGKVPPDELPRYLEAIDAKAGALTELINTFYEFSKTTHPDFRLDCREVNFGEYLREYLAEKYSEIDLAGFTLDVRIPETPVYCCIDQFQFGRVLDNILSNALRYNTLGTVVRVSLSTTRACVVLRIADNGIGIPDGLRERVFEPFTVGDDARSGSGSGLGLAIARRIAEAHHGSIRLLKNAGGETGTAFEILLPRTSGGSLTKS